MAESLPHSPSEAPLEWHSELVGETPLTLPLHADRRIIVDVLGGDTAEEGQLARVYLVQIPDVGAGALVQSFDPRTNRLEVDQEGQPFYRSLGEVANGQAEALGSRYAQEGNILTRLALAPVQLAVAEDGQSISLRHAKPEQGGLQVQWEAPAVPEPEPEPSPEQQRRERARQWAAAMESTGDVRICAKLNGRAGSRVDFGFSVFAKGSPKELTTDPEGIGYPAKLDQMVAAITTNPKAFQELLPHPAQRSDEFRLRGIHAANYLIPTLDQQSGEVCFLYLQWKVEESGGDTPILTTFRLPPEQAGGLVEELVEDPLLLDEVFRAHYSDLLQDGSLARRQVDRLRIFDDKVIAEKQTRFNARGWQQELWQTTQQDQIGRQRGLRRKSTSSGGLVMLGLSFGTPSGEVELPARAAEDVETTRLAQLWARRMNKVSQMTIEAKMNPEWTTATLGEATKDFTIAARLPNGSFRSSDIYAIPDGLSPALQAIWRTAAKESQLADEHTTEQDDVLPGTQMANYFIPVFGATEREGVSYANFMYLQWSAQGAALDRNGDTPIITSGWLPDHEAAALTEEILANPDLLDEIFCQQFAELLDQQVITRRRVERLRVLDGNSLQQLGTRRSRVRAAIGESLEDDAQARRAGNRDVTDKTGQVDFFGRAFRHPAGEHAPVRPDHELNPRQTARSRRLGVTL